MRINSVDLFLLDLTWVINAMLLQCGLSYPDKYIVKTFFLYLFPIKAKLIVLVIKVRSSSYVTHCFWEATPFLVHTHCSISNKYSPVVLCIFHIINGRALVPDYTVCIYSDSTLTLLHSVWKVMCVYVSLAISIC